MRAGALNRRMRFDRATEVQDASGDPVVTWTPLATVWASIEPLRGREALTDGAIRGELDTRIRIRWSPLLNDLSDKDRGVYIFDNTIYNVVSVAEVRMEHRELEILAKSGVNLG